MTQPDLNPCNVPGFIKNPNIDLPPEYCREEPGECLTGSQKDVASRDLSWLEEVSQKKSGVGQSALCDPAQTGHIINEQGMSAPNRNTIYRYSKSLRGTDEAVMDMFRDLVVIDEDGKAHNVPILWATQERAVAYVLQDNIRNDESLVVDRIRLPILAIHSSNYQYNLDRYTYHKAVDYLRTLKTGWKPGFTKQEFIPKDTVFGVTAGVPIDIGYTLYAWTRYQEDMNQIAEQIITKFSPLAYIRVRGIAWEIGVKLDSIANNVDTEPGDQANRVFKFEFGLTAESYVSQPLRRERSVLKTSIEVTDKLNDEDITEVITRLEEAVEELKE